MVYKLKIEDGVKADVELALLYYTAINTSLGDRFNNELYEAFDKLSQNPQHYSYVSAIWRTSLRDIKLPSFPYVVIFEIVDKVVLIVAVKNCYSQPINL